MKQLYTFKWSNGKVEKPLQASNVKHALMVLTKRLAQENPNEYENNIRIKVYTSFYNGELDYTLDEPYQHIRVPHPKPKPKTKPKKKKDGYTQMDFKGFTNQTP